MFVTGKVTTKQARQAIERDRRMSRPRMKVWQMNALQRRSELQRLSHYRAGAPGGRGNGIGWCWVVGNMVRVLHDQITPQLLRDEIEALELPPIAPAIITQVVGEIGGKAWGSYRLYGPDVAGENLMLTRVEREACGILKIDAIDEPTEERKRRLDRESKAKRRAARAAPQPAKPTIKAMSEALGVHRNTVRAWIKEGKLDPETGEILDCAKLVRGSVLTPISKEIDPRTDFAQSAAPSSGQVGVSTFISNTDHPGRAA